MKAIVHGGYGPPGAVLALQEIDPPSVADGEVLVRVRAAGVAKGDWLVTEGLPYIARPSYGVRRPKHRVAGMEVAGRVEAVGRGVTGLRAGDDVFGWCHGAFAEYAAAAEGALVPRPAGISFEQAATVPISGTAALQAVRDQGRVAPGQHVLVVGASGGVGTFAVQIAKAFGARVTGVCGPANVEMVRSLGTDHVIDYTRDDIDRDGRRYDVILDIAGNRSVAKLREVLSPRGTLVIVGGSGGRWTMGFGRTIRAVFASPFLRQRLRGLISTPKRDDLVALSELVESGRLTPVVASAHSLAEAPSVVADLARGHASGGTATLSLPETSVGGEEWGAVAEAPAVGRASDGVRRGPGAR